MQRERVYSIAGQLFAQDRLADPSKTASLTLSRAGNEQQARLSVDPVRAPLSPPFSRILLSADGQFLIEGVFSGSYNLSLNSKLAPSQQLLQKIDVAGKDVAGLKLHYALPTRVIGTIVVDLDSASDEKKEVLPKTIFLSNLDNEDEAPTLIRIGPGKSFLLEALTPGKYEAYAFIGSLPKSDYYPESVEWNGVAQSGTSFQHAGFPENKLVVRLKSGFASIQATAPREASMVFLFQTPFREIAKINGTFFYAEPGPDGAFTLSRVIPGRYKLCAVDSLESVNFMEWVNDPENEKTIEKFCHSMEVKRKDNLSVRLPLLSFSSENH